MPSEALQRLSVRWLPEAAYEDTTTVALNVSGYYIDLRVAKKDSTVQWGRAGERIMLKREPPTFRWTHIIDSLGLTVPDEAHFEKLPNGDAIEIGTTPCPHKGGVPTAYEEVWRGITAKSSAEELSWILQSEDGSVFIGKVGAIYLAIDKARNGGFAARREDRDSPSGDWNNSYESGSLDRLPRATEAIDAIKAGDQKWAEGQTVEIGGTTYVFRGVDRD